MREFLAEHWDDIVGIAGMLVMLLLGYLRGRADGRWEGYHKGRAGACNSSLVETLKVLCAKANCIVESRDGEIRIVDLPGKEGGAR